LRFASFAMACLREDLHLLRDVHAGRTNKTAARWGGREL
jgi:hypothetical protein